MGANGGPADTERRFVEVVKPFVVGATNYALEPGARVLAWRTPTEWVVYFNGWETRVPLDHAANAGSPEAKQAREAYSSARLEEYSLAPSPDPKA